MNKHLFDKISSKYIINKIFDFIKSRNFKLKIINHTKSLQSKLNITLYDYQYAYINKYNFEYDNYFHKYINRYINCFDKDSLNQNFQEDLKKCKVDINVFKKIEVDHFIQNENKLILKEGGDIIYEMPEKIIEIYSPLLDLISETEFFEKFCSILISIDIIQKYDLKNDYSSLFNKLNESNINYASLTINNKENYDVGILKQLNINFCKIKRLTSEYEDDENAEKSNSNNYDIFYNTLFSSFNVKNNLIYLKLKRRNKHYNKFNIKYINNLNDFKSLKVLILYEFDFNETFHLDLCNLEKLYMYFCTNIKISENTCLNLKDLYLDNCLILNNKSSLNFPKLKTCILKGYAYKDYNIIDFSKLINLEYFEGTKRYFLLLEKCKLEKIKLNYDENNSYELEKNVIKKLIEIKTLKSVNIELEYINDDDMTQIQGENNSLKDLKIIWIKRDKDCIIYNLQNKFPNLNSLDFHIEFTELMYDDGKNCITPTLDIKENINSKIDKFKLFIYNYNKSIKFYCQSFENLIEVKLQFSSDIKDLDKFFPLLNVNCPIVFKSLKVFSLIIQNNISNPLINLYNNINNNCVPNLKELSLQCDNLIDKDFYNKFIKKILSINLNIIQLNTIKYFEKSKLYSEEELKEIYPDINISKYNKLLIKKLD